MAPISKTVPPQKAAHNDESAQKVSSKWKTGRMIACCYKSPATAPMAIAESQKNGMAFGGFVGVVYISIMAGLHINKSGTKKIKESIREAIPDYEPEHYTFKRLKAITKNFNRELEDGAAYEGVLNNGKKVSVKLVDKISIQREKEFKAEVSTMAQIRHMNIVPLKGYCVDGSYRAIVYDFMPNGSLETWLLSSGGKYNLLDWSRRYNIAIGTARGLSYLHEECTERIIHLDLKPENILLDENFLPKISGFGISKLLNREKSRVLATTRGKPGYLAPELIHASSVTCKADVYSFGMVLLELICGRGSIDLAKGSEQWYLPSWAVRMVEEGKLFEMVDPRLREEVEFFFEDQVKRAIRVALCCIQADPTERPYMSTVVQMLTGIVEPKIPHFKKSVPVKRPARTNKPGDSTNAARPPASPSGYIMAPADHQESTLSEMEGSRLSEGGDENSSLRIFSSLSPGSTIDSTYGTLKALCIPSWPLEDEIENKPSQEPRVQTTFED